MSGKALKSLKDEKADLQKQIGCITGFFQLFERHRFITAQRSSSYNNIQHKPSSSGGSSNDIKQLNGKMQKTKAKNQKIAREKQQFSTESSTITSLSSSSCSSSMSSLDFNRTLQTESASTNRIRIPENTKQSLVFHHIVKDSMQRGESQELSVKTVARVENKGHQTHALKHIDSPRPLRSHKTVNAGVTVSSEPFHTHAKSKKMPWDSPRLSYDDTIKSVTKHKELPRLSLDSRDRSNKGFNEGNKSHNLLKGSQKGYERNSDTKFNQLKEPETSKISSSVVAKLMGLEALPERTQTSETSNCSTRKNELSARSSTGDEHKPHQRLALPQSKRVESITDVTPFSRFAQESTPWRKLDASQSSQLCAFKGGEYDRKASKSSLTVYGEIEKRVAELEFKKSGKDLRALKQILEAMQRRKDSLDIARDQASNSPSANRNSACLHESLKVQSPRIQQNGLTSSTVEMSNSIQDNKLPIVIMRPARVTRKANNHSSPIHGKSGLSKLSHSNPTNGKQTAKVINSTAKNIKDTLGQSVRSSDKNSNMKASKLMQSSKVPQDSHGKNTTNSGNVSIAVTSSPRLQKKFGLERRSPPTSPSSDSSIDRRELNRLPVELSSPSTTPRHKFSTLPERNEHFNKINGHWSIFKHHVNVISPDSDNQRSAATHSEIEIIRIDQSGKINSTSIQLSGMNQHISFEELRKESSKAEPIVTAEQPSPVSVLDAAFYKEDPPSPVNKKSDISKNLGETLCTDNDSEENSVEIFQEIDRIEEKLINLDNIKDPDHKYISEILLASGLLSGHSSSKIFHSKGYLINPMLFFSLEQLQTKNRHFHIEDSAKKISIYSERMQRKLIFDVVNDILVQKLIWNGSSARWCQPNELGGRKVDGKQLLDELCAEIDQLQPQNRNLSLVDADETLKHQNINWTTCCSEIPNIVLDIERLIFKDLITEVVRGEVASHPGMPCRQLLFPK